MKVKNIVLNDGNKIPQIGFGTWLLRPKETKEIIKNTYELGYRHIDTAQIYNNEYEIGLAIHELDRETLFITSKVWVENFQSKEIFLTSVRQSLKRLQIEQIDLMLVHWPIEENEYYIKAYKYLEEAKDLGLVKSIGVSNYFIEPLKELLKHVKYVPVINQISYSPINQQQELIDFCKKQGIMIEGYSIIKPYLGTSLTDNLNAKEKIIVEDIALKYGKTAPELILKWALQNDIIIFPKSSNQKRIETNIKLNSFKISDKDMEKIDNLDRDNYDFSKQIYQQKGRGINYLKNEPLLFERHFIKK